MAFANSDKSARLQRVLKLLGDGEKHDTRDIMYKADVCAVSTCIDELRSNGKEIRSSRKGRIHYYQLMMF